MGINFDDVRQLERTSVREREKWLYSADFNVKYSRKPDGSIQLKSHDRIDSECEDLLHISRSGGVAVILAHQGRYKDGDTTHLDFVVPYLSEKLGSEMKYFGENNTEEAVRFIDGLNAGTVVIMGNTRFHRGEEENDPVLAEQFARLVIRPDQKSHAAIGGFGKAHRKHASNVGILEYLPGYATRSQIREMQLLEFWAGKSSEYSVAVLGGIKKEKITEGLVGFAETYDVIIPGGIVLNTIYLVQGKRIGKSVTEDGGKKYDRYVKEILESANTKKICIPKEVIIARPVDNSFEDSKKILIDRGVPEGYMIVDFILPDLAFESLEKLTLQGGRLVLAGTPGIYTAGFRTATDSILGYMNRNNIQAIALGGDTVSELSFVGPSSTGGGSALSFVSNGTTSVFEALKINKNNFPNLDF